MWILIAGWSAAALVFAAFFMKTMVPLRLAAIASNVAFMAYALLGILYGDFGKLYPIFVLHACLLPLNVLRLQQLRRLVRAVGEASSEQAVRALVPFMTLQQYRAGDVVFRDGDAADRLYVLQQGQVVFPELGRAVGAGSIFGEVGLFSQAGVRSSSAVCERECRIAAIDGQRTLELAYQNPEFATCLLRLLAGYAAEPSAPASVA